MNGSSRKRKWKRAKPPTRHFPEKKMERPISRTASGSASTRPGLASASTSPGRVVSSRDSRWSRTPRNHWEQSAGGESPVCRRLASYFANPVADRRIAEGVESDEFAVRVVGEDVGI